MKALAAFSFSLVVLLSFGCGDDEANEARLLIDRIEGLGDPDLDARRQRVNALMRLPIASPRVQAVHEACVPMHEALLRADEATIDAHAAVNELEAAALVRHPLGWTVLGPCLVAGASYSYCPKLRPLLRHFEEEGDRSAGDRAADAMARLQSAVLEVSDRRASCEDLLAQLRTRYEPRRESGH